MDKADISFKTPDESFSMTTKASFSDHENPSTSGKLRITGVERVSVTPDRSAEQDIASMSPVISEGRTSTRRSAVELGAMDSSWSIRRRTDLRDLDLVETWSDDTSAEPLNRTRPLIKGKRKRSSPREDIRSGRVSPEIPVGDQRDSCPLYGRSTSNLFGEFMDILQGMEKINGRSPKSQETQDRLAKRFGKCALKAEMIMRVLMERAEIAKRDTLLVQRMDEDFSRLARENRDLKTSLRKLELANTRLSEEVALLKAKPAAEGSQSVPLDLGGKKESDLVESIVSRVISDLRSQGFLVPSAVPGKSGTSVLPAEVKKNEKKLSYSQILRKEITSTSVAPSASETDVEWSLASRKKKRRIRKKEEESRDSLPPPPLPSLGKGGRGTPRGKKKEEEIGSVLPARRKIASSVDVSVSNNTAAFVKRRVPRSSAVMIGGEDHQSSVEAFRRVRSVVQLDEVGITKTSVKYTRSGKVLIEVFGENHDSKADVLADKLRSVVSPSIRINRPIKFASLKLVGLEKSISKEEVISSLCRIGGCKSEDVILGAPVQLSSLLNIVCAKCPLRTALKIAKLQKIVIGWSNVRVVLERDQPMQCFKCLEFGHMAIDCKSSQDRSKACYRCGERGHCAKNCSNALKCIVCLEKGRQADHRIGSAKCGAVVLPLDGKRVPTNLTEKPVKN